MRTHTHSNIFVWESVEKQGSYEVRYGNHTVRAHTFAFQPTSAPMPGRDTHAAIFFYYYHLSTSNPFSWSNHHSWQSYHTSVTHTHTRTGVRTGWVNQLQNNEKICLPTFHQARHRCIASDGATKTAEPKQNRKRLTASHKKKNNSTMTEDAGNVSNKFSTPPLAPLPREILKTLSCCERHNAPALVRATLWA